MYVYAQYKGGLSTAVREDKKRRQERGANRSSEKDVSGRQSNGIDSACGDDSVVERNLLDGSTTE